MIARLRRKLAAVLSRSRFEVEMSAELRSHLEHRIDDLVAHGLTREDATRTARVEFGALEARKEDCRDSRGFTAARITQGLWGDVRLATRRLRSSPLFVAFAVLSLALGLGLTITSYAVLEALVWTSIGIAEPTRVVVITVPGGLSDEGHPASMSRNDFDQVRSGQRTLSALAATATFSRTLVTPSGNFALRGQAVSGDYFTVVRVSAALGRTLQPLDDARATPVLVLSDVVWRTRFGADPTIVGRTVRLGGQPFEIVGVMPRRFHGTSRSPGAWIPLAAAMPFVGAVGNPRERRDLSIVGRLASGYTLLSAGTEFATIGRELDRTQPLATLDEQANGGERPRRWSAQSIEVLGRVPDDIAKLLLFVVAMVLIVACTNLANLLLARGTMRLHEIAVRRSLGASRWRLVRELCVESTVIGVLGAGAAIAVTRWLLDQVPPDLPAFGMAFPIEAVVSPTVLLVTAGALLVSLLGFGLAPAIQLTRKPVSVELASEAGTGDRRRMLRHRQLIRWQVAITSCFFVIVSMAGRVLVGTARHDSGMKLEGLAVATIGGTSDWDQGRVRRAVEDILATAAEQPDVEAVSASVGLPFGVAALSVPVTTPDQPFAEGRSVFATNPRQAYLIPATYDFFRTLGIPIVTGRAFDAGDDGSARPVAVLNEKMARRFFGTREAVGRQITFRNQGDVVTSTVVGIAADTDTMSFRGYRGDVLYVPLHQQYVRGQLTITARGARPAEAARTLQAAIRGADPDISTTSYGEASALLTFPFYQLGLVAAGVGALGVLTLLLGMVGLYGVQSQTVAHRTREVGVRVALGATARQIQRMILKAGLVPVVQGLALGLAIGSLTRLVFRVILERPIALVDPLALIVVPIPVVVAAYLACRVPASRAARVDPTVALRHL